MNNSKDLTDRWTDVALLLFPAIQRFYTVCSLRSRYILNVLSYPFKVVFMPVERTDRRTCERTNHDYNKKALHKKIDISIYKPAAYQTDDTP